MSKKPYQQWSVDDVSNWLVTIHLSNLVPVFERHDISGVTLPYVDETFMKDRLRMAKPAEVASLKGALAHLLESAEAQLQYPHRKPIPRPPPQAQKATRPGEGGVMKSPPVPMRQKSSTMPNKKNFFVPTAEVQLREPQLVIAPAQDLLDDHCKHSGWIKKQGGSHKSCECVDVFCCLLACFQPFGRDFLYSVSYVCVPVCTNLCTVCVHVCTCMYAHMYMCMWCLCVCVCVVCACCVCVCVSLYMHVC